MEFVETWRDKRPAPPEGVELHVAGERSEYVVGVDIGQKRDYTAIAILPRNSSRSARSVLSSTQFGDTSIIPATQ